MFPHQAGVTQRSPCFLTPRPSTYLRCQLEQLVCATLSRSSSPQQPDQAGKRPSAWCTVPAEKTCSSFSLAKDFGCHSLSQQWHGHLETGSLSFRSYKPWPDPKLHSETCCEIVYDQDYASRGTFSSFVHLNVSSFNVSPCLYATRCPSPVLERGQWQGGQREKDTHSCTGIGEHGGGHSWFWKELMIWKQLWL